MALAGLPCLGSPVSRHYLSVLDCAEHRGTAVDLHCNSAAAGQLNVTSACARRRDTFPPWREEGEPDAAGDDGGRQATFSLPGDAAAARFGEPFGEPTPPDAGRRKAT